MVGQSCTSIDVCVFRKILISIVRKTKLGDIMLIGLEANTNTKYLPAPFHELQYFEGLLLKLMCGNESELNQA